MSATRCRTWPAVSGVHSRSFVSNFSARASMVVSSDGVHGRSIALLSLPHQSSRLRLHLLAPTPRPPYPQHLDLLMQVRPLHVQHAGGGGEVPADPAEDALDVLALALSLEVAQGDDGQRGRGEEEAGLCAGGLEEGGGELVRRQRIGAEDDQALAEVAQLADVARPGVTLQVRQQFRVRLPRARAVLPRKMLQKVVEERGDVLAPFAQRRDRNRQVGEAEVEIVAEAP